MQVAIPISGHLVVRTCWWNSLIQNNKPGVMLEVVWQKESPNACHISSYIWNMELLTHKYMFNHITSYLCNISYFINCLVGIWNLSTWICQSVSSSATNTTASLIMSRVCCTKTFSICMDVLLQMVTCLVLNVFFLRVYDCCACACHDSGFLSNFIHMHPVQFIDNVTHREWCNFMMILSVIRICNTSTCNKQVYIRAHLVTATKSTKACSYSAKK